MSHFTITYVMKSGERLKANCHSFAEAYTLAPNWEDVKSLQLNFSPAVPETPLLFENLHIKGNCVLYGSPEGGHPIQLGRNMVEDILRHSAQEIRSIYPEGSAGAEDMGRYFDSRNARLFEMLDVPDAAEESDSWAPAMAALAAVGLASIIKKKKAQRAQGEVIQQEAVEIAELAVKN